MTPDKPRFLLVGGLVAAGFTPDGSYLLTVSHSGRGVFSTRTWDRVAREGRPAYPIDGHATGIGPIRGLRIPVIDVVDVTELRSPSGELRLHCESDGITVTSDEC